MQSVTVEALRSQDAYSIVTLYRVCFPADHVQRTVLGCRGAAAYVASLMRFPALQTDDVFIGVRRGDGLQAFAHCRAVANQWHLNHICVHPRAQGTGLGTAMMQRYVGLARERGYATLSLRVEAGSERLLGWYRSWGFYVERTWCQAEYPNPFAHTTPALPEGVCLLRWSGAEAWHAVYGFSSFDLSHSGEVLPVRRLGERYFGLDRPVPDTVLRALAYIDSDRRLLVEGTAVTAQQGTVRRHCSMRADLDRTAICGLGHTS